jgi:hypothetical protein
MASAFGFSVGDFINGIVLIKDLIQALQESSGSSEEFVEVIKELYSLEKALIEVNTLQFSSEESIQHAALLQTISQCRSSIDTFIAGISKYQPHLRIGGSSEYCISILRKIQWRLCKRDELIRFRSEIAFHVESIQLLMLRIGM